MNKKFLLTLAAIFFLIDCALLTYKLSQKEHSTKAIHKAKPNYKYSIYLTSDDGPLKGSKALNQLVLDYEFPLTLFLVGRPLSQDANLEPHLTAYKNNPYLLLGNHSFSHANFRYKRFYKDAANVEKDFLQNERFLGIYSKLGRLPGRNVWAVDGVLKGESDALESAKVIASNDRYKFFGWDYEIHYNPKTKATLKSALEHYKRIKYILKNQQTFAKNQIVILMHDQMFTNQESQKMIGELVLLLQNDSECKLKLLNKFTMTPTHTTIAKASEY